MHEWRREEVLRVTSLCWWDRCCIYLKAVFFLLVDGIHAGERGDELEGGERLVGLLADSPLREHLLHHLDNVSLREAISDFRQATDTQGVCDDTAVSLNGLLPQNCCVQDDGRDREWESAERKQVNPVPATSLPLTEKGEHRGLLQFVWARGQRTKHSALRDFSPTRHAHRWPWVLQILESLVNWQEKI